MMTFESKQTIARSAEELWAYAADIERHPDWMTVTDSRIVRGAGDQAGARGRERLRLGPFEWDVEFEVAEAERGRRLRWRAVSGAPFDLEVALQLEPVGTAQTRAMYEATIRLRGLWRLLTPLIKLEAKAGGPAGELQRLKEQVEEVEAVASATASWRAP